MTASSQLNIAHPSNTYNVVSLIEPTDSGYIHLAAEVDGRHPFLPMSQTKRALINQCKVICKELSQSSDVLSAVVFKALLIPPGQGEYLKQRPDVHVARFDISILIEMSTVEAAKQMRTNELFKELETHLRQTAKYTHVITASNARRIGPVDHKRDGVFLFNYFYADDVDQNLAVWKYTAGWFEQETGLDNSTLLLPENHEKSNYTVVNHCRWDHLIDIVPSLIFKPTFRTYVLGNFEANRTAPIPILYRLA